MKTYEKAWIFLNPRTLAPAPTSTLAAFTSALVFIQHHVKTYNLLIWHRTYNKSQFHKKSLR